MSLVLKSLLHLFLSNWVPAHIPQSRCMAQGQKHKEMLDKGTICAHFVNVFLIKIHYKWLDLLNACIYFCDRIVSVTSKILWLYVLAVDTCIYMYVYWEDDPRFFGNTLKKFQSLFTFPQVGQAKAMSKIKAWSSHIIRHFWYCSSVCKISSTTSDEEALKIMKVQCTCMYP